MRIPLIRVSIVLIFLLTACVPNNAPLGPEAIDAGLTATSAIEIEVAREGVFAVKEGERQPLSAAEQVTVLETDQGIAVDANGRAILYFGEQMTLELLGNGELPQIQQHAVDVPVDQETTVSVAQNGGVLIADLTLLPESKNTLTVQTAFATISAANTRFAVVREANSPLEWILALETGDNAKLEVTSGGVTLPVAGGEARWLTSIDGPGPAIVIDQTAQAWLEGARNNVDQPELGQVLLAPANIVVDAGLFSTAPKPGHTFEFGRGVQGAVNLTLDPQGIFGTPVYTLEDCNGDNVSDLLIKNGMLDFDFRLLPARVEALDITLLNRGQPGNGLWQAIDPSGTTVSMQQVAVAAGQTQTLSLRDNPPYHYARLTVSEACFMGISLTPPGSTGQPADVRPTAPPPQVEQQNTAQQDAVVVNVLSASADRLPENGQFQAPFVNVTQIEIDGAQSDWDSMARQNGVSWIPFASITHDAGCATRFPDAGIPTDLSGQVLFAYNDRFLYVAFLVDDDGLVTYSGDDNRLFLGDSLQLLLDLDLNADFDDVQLSSDDAQIDLLPAVDAPQAVLWYLNSLTAKNLAGVQLFTTPTDNGYFAEAAIPWAELGVAPQPGDRLGVVASINDNDTPGTNAQECIISTSPQRDWQNPTTWGTVLLKPSQ